MPPSWSDQLTGNKLILSKVEETRPEHGAEILRCICIESDLSFKVYVYGKEVPVQSCSILCSFGQKINSSSLQALIGVVDESNVCKGNYEDPLLS